MSLASPLTFRNGVRAKNRAWLAPMTNEQSNLDGTLGDDELRWITMRADGGFGVVETCAAHVAKDGQGWVGELGIYDDAMIPGLTRLASAIAERGALGLVQIFHGGLRAPEAVTGKQPWSASACTVKGAETPREGTEEEIVRVIGEFASAARRAEQAGFQGVELHGAHGYLLAQFLSTVTNTRTDRWGGDFEGRSRLLFETVSAVRSAVSANFLVGVRLSPEDFGSSLGIDLDESLRVAKELADRGIDFFHASLWDSSKNTAKRPAEHPIPLFRAALPQDVPLIVAGNIWTLADAELAMERGADAVAIGRAAITNPNWANEVVDPSWEPRRPPMTVAELEARGLSARFAGYMRRWKGFVSD